VVDLVDRLKETLIALKDNGTPSKYRHSVHAAIHALIAIDALHQPFDETGWKHSFCEMCDVEWPCPTHLLIHSEE
jgi:hypothetical protein